VAGGRHVRRRRSGSIGGGAMPAAISLDLFADSVPPRGGPVELHTLRAGYAAPVVEKLFAFEAGGCLGHSHFSGDENVWDEIIDPAASLCGRAIPLGGRRLDRGGGGIFLVSGIWLLVSIAVALLWHCAVTDRPLILFLFFPTLVCCRACVGFRFRNQLGFFLNALVPIPVVQQEDFGATQERIDGFAEPSRRRAALLCETRHVCRDRAAPVVHHRHKGDVDAGLSSREATSSAEPVGREEPEPWQPAHAATFDCGRWTPSGHARSSGQFNENQAMTSSNFRSVKLPPSIFVKKRQSPAAACATVLGLRFVRAQYALRQAERLVRVSVPMPLSLVGNIRLCNGYFRQIFDWLSGCDYRIFPAWQVMN
jgi:hypothetical protein